MVVHCLRFHIVNAGGWGLIPGWGTGAHMLQLRPLLAKQKPSNQKNTPLRYLFPKEIALKGHCKFYEAQMSC